MDGGLTVKRPAVFIDRDGTLIRDLHFLSRPEQIEFLPGSLEALRLLQDAGWVRILVSNQSGVARGHFGLKEVEAVHHALEALLEGEGLSLDGIYFCPHHPEGIVPEFTRRCDCRKPQPGMIDRATRDLDLDLDGSWIVGDKPDDVRLSENRTLRPILVRTGYGRESAAELAGYPGLFVAVDLLDAIRHILKEEERA